MRFLAELANPILYFPRLRPLAGSVTASILMVQLEYWFKKKPDGFYKFLEPCKHSGYKHGDSWTESLGFSAAEFRNAFSHIGIAYPSKRAYKEALAADNVFRKEAKTATRITKQGNPLSVSAREQSESEKFYCSVRDRISGLTVYYRNDKFTDKSISELIAAKESKYDPPCSVNQHSQVTEDSLNQHNEFTDINNVDLRRSTNLISLNQHSQSPLNTETTSETTSETTHLRSGVREESDSEVSESDSNPKIVSAHKCWGEPQDSPIVKNPIGKALAISQPRKTTPQPPAAPRHLEIARTQSETKNETQANENDSQSLQRGKKLTGLDALADLLNRMPSESVGSPLLQEMRVGQMLPWMTPRFTPDLTFATWIGKDLPWDKGETPSNAQKQQKGSRYIQNALKDATSLRKLMCDWEIYQEQLTRADEPASVSSPTFSKSVMDILQGKSNWRHKSIDVYEPLEWRPGMPLAIPEEERVTPKGASDEFQRAMSADIAKRDKAIHWNEMAANIAKYHRERGGRGAEVFVKLYVNEVYVHWARTVSKKEPCNPYFIYKDVSITLGWCCYLGYADLVPESVRARCTKIGNSLASAAKKNKK